MKRVITILTVLSLLVLATSAVAQNRYGWTISDSTTDPLSNSGAPLGGLGTLYLWYNCSTVQGMSAAEFDLAGLGISVLASTPQNGYLNAGGSTNLLLAVGGCPPGPVIAVNILVLDAAGGTVCLQPSILGNKGTVDCEPVPSLFPIDWIGFNSGPTPCSKGEQCPPDAVQETSWGQLKSLYR